MKKVLLNIYFLSISMAMMLFGISLVVFSISFMIPDYVLTTIFGILMVASLLYVIAGLLVILKKYEGYMVDDI